MVFDLGERDDCFGTLDWLASPMAEIEITSSHEAESEKYSKDNSKDTAGCEPVPSRVVSKNLRRYSMRMNSLRRCRLY